MQEVVYLANVGTRDITLDGEPLKKPREDGNKLLRAYEAFREAFASRLDAPILFPGLRRAIQAAGRVDRLVLFASDQPETTDLRYRDFDTVHIAELLRRWLPTHPHLKGRLADVVVVQIPGNPADYNCTIPFYHKTIPSLVACPPRLVYVAPVGGADASNVALWLAALRNFRAAVEVIYVTPEGRVEQVPLARLLLRDQIAHQAQVLLDHYDYPALAALLTRDTEWGNTWRPHLVHAVAERLHFNFRGAQEALNRALALAAGEPKGWIGQLYDEVKSLREVFEQRVTPPCSGEDESVWQLWLEKQRMGLAELYWNLAVKARRGEWVDFLGRIFRLAEGLLRLIFEQESRHSTELDKSGTAQDFASYVKSSPELVSYLRSQGVQIANASEVPGPNIRVLSAILEYWVMRSQGETRLGPAYGAVKAIQELAALRNKTIIAHGWKGVGREEVEQAGKLNIDALLVRIRQGLEAVGVRI
jgi:hypothetical protein